MESSGMTSNPASPTPPAEKPPGEDVLQRLLLAKEFLSKIDVVPTIRPDSLTVARYILIAHDASELVLAAIARHLDCLPPDNEAYLMKYAGALRTKTGHDIPNRSFFSDLNRQRISIKHHGLMPNVDQSGNVAENAHRNIAALCEKYLGIQLSDLDESILVRHEKAKLLIAEAKALFAGSDYKAVLEKVAYALFVLFRDNPALRKMTIGKPDAQDAIKLTAFGVNANEFLALQEFLPSVSENEGKVSFRWAQDDFGHPGNWTDEPADFCLRTVIHVAVRIQNASWIPAAIPLLFVYEHRVTSLEDGVEIVREGGTILTGGDGKRTVVRILSKGESIRGIVSRKERMPSLFGFGVARDTGPEMISFHGYEPKGIWGDIEASKVAVMCVPRQNEFIKEHYPDLPEIPWEHS